MQPTVTHWIPLPAPPGTPPTPLTWSLLTPEDPQYGRSLTGEVLGVRLLPDGLREYLMKNLGLCAPYYVMESK